PRLAVDQGAHLNGGGSPANKSTASGRIVFVAEQAQADTGNFFVKVRFPNSERKLRANSVLRVEIVTQAEKERLTIPDAAVQEDQQPPIVIVADEIKVEKEAGKDVKTAKARKLQVLLGVRDRARHVIEVLKLIDPESHDTVDPRGQSFVIEGGHGLHNGD